MNHCTNILSAGALALGITALAAPAQADILARWDAWADADAASATSPYVPDGTLAGFSASIAHSGTSTPTFRTNSSFGSTDGTYGTLAGAPAAVKGLLVRGQNGEHTLTLTLTNNTGSDYDVESFHFDFAPREQDAGSKGLNGFVLTYVSGGLGTDGTVIDSQTGLSYIITTSQDLAAEGEYPDYDYDLSTSLSDTTLADGESAVFTLAFTAPSENYSQSVSSVVDNIALVGSVVPEPASLVLLSAGLALIAGRRRA